MTKRISPKILRKLRNDILIEKLITNTLRIPYKHCEGYLRFLCPLCLEFHSATKKETNLARCFCCKKNFNPIDMVMISRQMDFLAAVVFLKKLL